MPLAIGSTTVVIASVFLVPAAIAAFVHVHVRWLVAAGVVLAIVWYGGAIIADDEPDDLGAAGGGVIAGFLLVVWITGCLLGRLLRSRFRARR